MAESIRLPDLVFYTDDSPRANGRTPLLGEREHVFTFLLDNGTTLAIQCGQLCYDSFAGFLRQMATDDALDDALATGARPAVEVLHNLEGHAAPWHRAMGPGHVVCDADLPGMHSTSIAEHVTCPACLAVEFVVPPEAIRHPHAIGCPNPTCGALLSSAQCVKRVAHRESLRCPRCYWPVQANPKGVW